jgi:MFS family permease
MGPAGVFMTQLQEDFGATRAAVSLAGPILACMMMSVGLFLGPVLDRGSIRRVMLAGVGVMLIGLLGLSRGRNLTEVGLLLAVASIGMSMYGTLPSQVLLVNWFTRLRGRALALSTVGMSVSGFLLPPLSAALVAAYGWRDALGWIAVSAAALAFPLIFAFVIDRPSDVGQHPDGDTGTPAEPPVTLRRPIGIFLREPNFWLVSFGMGFALCSLAVAMHLVPFGQSLGLSLQSAAWAPPALSSGSLLGKLLGGWSIDRLGKRITVTTLLFVQGLGWATLATEPDFSGLLAGAALVGFGAGGFLPLPPVYLAVCFGPRVVGQASGLSGAATLPIQMMAPLLAGASFDRSGNYTEAFQSMLAVVAIATLLLLLIRPPNTAEA